MYIGNEGLIGLFAGLIHDCIKIYATDKIQFNVFIISETKFSISIYSKSSNIHFLKICQQDLYDHNYISIIKELSLYFDIQDNIKNKIILTFELDSLILKASKLDYNELCNKFTQVAILNRHTEIITKDLRFKVISQNYYHFPQGVFYLFDRQLKIALGKPIFNIAFDNVIEQNRYQIGIAYRTDWYPSATLLSFANDVNTICGGSLIDGILDGLLTFFKQYLKDKNLNNFKLSRKKLCNGLIVVCSVRGDSFNYKGSFREKLTDEKVRKTSAKIILDLIYETMLIDEQMVDSLLWRFDNNPYQHLFEKSD